MRIQESEESVKTAALMKKTSIEEIKSGIKADTLASGESDAIGCDATVNTVNTAKLFPSAVKLDMSSLEMFPALSSASPVQKPAWLASTGSEAASAKAGSPAGASGAKPGVISRVFQLPFEQQRKYRDFGDRTSLADFCQQVTKSTNGATSIEASTSAKTRAITFVIRGLEADVMNARRLLWAKLAESIVIELSVPLELRRFVTGPGGSNLHTLIAETGTKINVPKQDDPHGHVVISGDADGVAMAKGRIEAIIREQTNKMTTTVEIDRHLAQFVLGGSSIFKEVNALVEKFGVRISTSISKNPDSTAVPSETLSIVISGDREKVMPAAEHLRSTYEQCKKSVKSVSTSISKALHRFLIGPKAVTLHAMESETNCIFIIPPADSASEQVQIYGMEGNLIKGLTAILEKTGSMATECVAADANVRLLMSHRHRQKLRDIELAHSVNIFSINTGYEIDGKKEQVAAAVAELGSILKPLQELVFENFLIEHRFTKHIIGKQGHNIQQIQSEHNVHIVIPSDSRQDIDPEERDNIILAGPSTSVIEQVKQHLASTIAALADIVSITIKVDSKLRERMLGKGVLRRLQERHPSVMARFSEDDSILLRGLKNEVDPFAEELRAQLEAIRHDAIMHAYTVEAALSKENAKCLAVQRHATFIQNLCRQKDIKIEMVLGTDRPKITLQGVKKSVDDALPEILEQVSRLADQVTESFEIDSKYLDRLIGRDRKNAKHLLQRYGTSITTSNMKDSPNKSSIFLIGSRGNVAKAKEELLELLEYEMQHSHKEEIHVPSTAVRFIIGKAGTVIGGIRDEFDVSIDVMDDKEAAKRQQSGADNAGKSAANGADGEADAPAKPVSIFITGTLEGIAKARRAIEEIVQTQAEQVTEEVAVDRDLFKIVTVSCAQSYRDLVERYDNRVMIIAVSGDAGRSAEDGTALPCHFTLKGKNTLVAAAKEELLAIIDESKSVRTVEVSIPQRFHGQIIGNKGASVRKICVDYGVEIHFPRSTHGKNAPSSTNDLIKVTGPMDKIEAVTPVLKSFVKMTNVVTVPQGIRGLVLEKITADLASLNVQASTTRGGVMLSGGAAEVSNAVALINGAVEAMHADIVVEKARIPSEYYGHIIGKQGAKLQAIQDETGCSITVPKTNDQLDEVVFEGTKNSVEAAKGLVHKIVEAQKALKGKPGTDDSA